MRQLNFIIILVLSFLIFPLQAKDFVLPSIISNHAVMQRNTEVKLWGWCPSIWDLKIVCSWNPEDTIHVKSNKNCYWETKINTPETVGPHNIRFYGWENKLVEEVDDVLMGETWLCSGQSNMEYWLTYRVSDAGDITEALNNKQVRFFRVAKACSKFPVERIEGKWEICSPETSKNFSAVGFFFGQRLNEKLNVPVGLVGSYWGGTSIEPWIDEVTYKSDKSLVGKSQKLMAEWAPTANSSLFNAMIYPITNYALAGVIWYQGEANNIRAGDYGDMFSSMINGWRKAFDRTLPFYFVQIAPWNGYEGKNAAYLREQQAEVLKRQDHTGMVVVGDLVEDLTEIHPSQKKQVGVRLANLALKQSYQQNDLQPYSPVLKSFIINGQKIILTTTALGKLNCTGKIIENFEILDKEGNIFPGKVSILKNGDISVSSDKVKKPVAVRYCFTNAAVPNLFDINGLPLAPFRTDK